MPRAVIIQNPRARNAVPEPMLRAAALALHGWECEVRATEDAHGPEALARSAVQGGADAVFACGGDGTLNGVLNGVVDGVRASGHAKMVVGLIPAGTANVWAREAGIPRDPLGALHLLERGRVVDLDVGVVRIGDEIERRFLLMCSAGFDARVVGRVESSPRLKRRLAQGAYIVAGCRASVGWRSVPVYVDWDGARPGRSVFIAVAGNSRLYGGMSRLTSAARMDDGLLDLALFEARSGPIGLVDRLTHLVRGLLRGGRPWHEVSTSRFEYRRAPSFRLRPSAPLAVQIDGEFLTTVATGGSLSLEVESRAIRMLVPPGPNPLFAGDEPTQPS